MIKPVDKLIVKKYREKAKREYAILSSIYEEFPFLDEVNVYEVPDFLGIIVRAVYSNKVSVVKIKNRDNIHMAIEFMKKELRAVWG